MKTYSVYQDSVPFGTAEIIREGLYYRIQIRCPNAVRVTVAGANGMRDLGICVPLEEKFVIQTRVPIKQLGEGEMYFCVHSEKNAFVPVETDKPFEHLDMIRDSALSFQNGQIGVQTSISKPIGQWSEPNTSE